MFLRMLLRGEIGAGESFVAGEWSRRRSRRDAARVHRAAPRARGFESPLTRLAQLPALVRHRRAANTRTGSERNIHAHYDLGNAFYRLFLDPETLSYSCGVFDGAASLADAQHAKHERLCELLELSPRDHLLEIGCGWGGMAIHAARTRGCRVTAITVSREQHELATARVAAAGLADRVVDRVSRLSRSRRHVRQDRLDRDARGGRLRVPARRTSRPARACSRPVAGSRCRRSRCPTIGSRRIARASTGCRPTSSPARASRRSPRSATRLAPTRLRITRADDIGPTTHRRSARGASAFVAALPEVRALGFDEPFVRTWLLYLAFSEAAFAERTLGDHQLVFAR